MNDNTYKPSPLVAVECQQAGDRWTLVFTRHLHHEPAKVWAALTEPRRLAQWSPFTADRNLDEVGAATLTMIDGETEEVVEASVQRVEPPELLEYTWGKNVLRWELAATQSGTQLTLRHTIEDRDWVPKIAAGWHLCLDVAERFLDGRPIAPIRGADAMNYGWQSLNDAYAERLGIENTGLPEHLTSD